MAILVTGSTGTVGHHVVEQLNQARQAVRALTRNPAKARFPEGVKVVKGDLTQIDTLTPALKGVTGLHLITFGGDNYAPLQNAPEIVAAAEKAGVGRVTVLTGGFKGAVEQAVEASSMDWTMLMPVEFMSNILGWAESIRKDSVVRQPYGSRQTAIVHEADIAAVAATALMEAGHGGKTYAITGPEVLTPRKMTQIIGETIGRKIEFVELTPEEAKTEWLAAGHPPQVVDFLLWAYGNTPPAGYTVVPTVEQVTGHPARSFAQWVEEHREVFGG